MLVLKEVKEEKANLEAEHAKLLEECKQLQEEIGELRYENHTLNETIGKLERWYVENIWFDGVEMSYYFKKWKSSLSLWVGCLLCVSRAAICLFTFTVLRTLRVCLHGGGGPQVGEVNRPFSPIRYSFITVNKSLLMSKVMILKMPLTVFFLFFFFIWKSKSSIRVSRKRWSPILSYRLHDRGRVKALFASSAGYSFLEIIARVGGEISRRVV